MALTARDLMTREVVTIPATMSLGEAWRRLTEHKINGAPVIDDSGHLVGVISQTDLAAKAFTDRFDPSRASSFYHAIPFSEDGPHELTGSREEILRIPVAELMNPYVIAVEETDRIQLIAQLMRNRRIHRVIVAEHNRVTGILSALDLLKALE